MHELPNVMEWLEHGVPVTLVVDLLDAKGPDSRRILAEEPGDSSWFRGDLTAA